MKQSNRPPYLLILSGPAASGKSTIAEMLWRTLPDRPAYLSLDALKHLIYDTPSTDYFLELASRNGLSLVRNFLDQGHSVIIDKAFGKYDYVEPFLKEGRERNIPIHYFKLQASLDELLRRNKVRTHCLPDEKVAAIYHFHKQYDHPQGTVIDVEAHSVSDAVRHITETLLRGVEN